MSVDTRNLEAYGQKLHNLKADISTIMNKLIVEEGIYAVKQAKKISASESGLHNTGNYMNNFHAGDKAMQFTGANIFDGSIPKRHGTWFKIDVYNNLNYAKHLEHGFRSHFVPGHWEGRSFVYQRNDPEGGMYVGKPGEIVNGHFTLRRAVRRTKLSQEARLTRKINKIFKERLQD